MGLVVPLTNFCKWPCSHRQSSATWIWSIIVRLCQFFLLIPLIRNGMGTLCNYFSNALALPVGPLISAYTSLGWLSKYAHHAKASARLGKVIWECLRYKKVPKSLFYRITRLILSLYNNAWYYGWRGRGDVGIWNQVL